MVGIKNREKGRERLCSVNVNPFFVKGLRMKTYSMWMAGAVATAALWSGSLADAALLTYDLRIAGGGKAASVAAVNDVVNLELWAILSTDNTNPNDKFTIGMGSIKSSNGGLLGNLSSTLVSPYAGAGVSANGTPTTLLDADGDTDIGGPLPSDTGTFNGLIADGGINGQSGQQFKLANLTFTVSSLASSTNLNFIPRVKTGGTVASRQVHKFTIDGANFSLEGTNANVGIGTDVVISQLVSGNNSQILIDAADSSSTVTGASDKAVSFGNLLKGATVSSAVSLGKTGTDATTYTATAGGSATSTFAGGNIAAGPQTINGSVGISTAAYNGSAIGTVTIDNTAGDSAAGGKGSADANDVFNVSANVGNAVVGVTTGTFGTALTAPVAPAGSYAGLASRTTQGVNGALGNEAEIADGANSAGNDTVSMAWRTRTAGETFPNDPPVLSDVVDLTGIAAGDLFVLKMYYKAGDVPVSIPESTLALGWNDIGFDGWENAVTGNTGGTATRINGSWTVIGGLDAGDLGKYGVDDTDVNYNGVNYGGYVWAVLNHNSEFAVIPEPASLGLLALGGLALLGRRRRA